MGLVASATTSIRAMTLPDNGHSWVLPVKAPDVLGTGLSGAVAPNTPALARWTLTAGRAVSGAGIAVCPQAWYRPEPRLGARLTRSCGAMSEPASKMPLTVLAR